MLSRVAVWLVLSARTRTATSITSGAWFWAMAGINRQISDAIKVKPTYTAPRYDKMSKFWRLELENEMTRINSTVMPKVNPDRMDIAGLAGQGDVHGWISRWTNKAFGAITQSISTTVLEGGHTESKLQSLGHYLIVGTEALWAGMVIARATAAAADGAVDNSPAEFIPFLGSAAGGTSEFIKSITNDVTNLLSKFCFALIILGLLLSFYFPAIPFINWFAAIIGWLVMLLEAVFAAPFWAAAHAVPEGEGIAGNHGKAGWMLVLSLIARPVLMIAGLVGAMLLLHYGSELLLVMFVPFAKSMTADSVFGLVSLLAMIAILVALVLSLGNRAFSLIYVIPDRTLAWIGQSGANLGETQTGEESKTMIMGAARGGDRVAQGAADGMAKGKGGQGQNKQGTDNDSDKTKATNNAEEEMHAPGNILAKGEGQGGKTSGQEGQHAAGGGMSPRQQDDRNA